MLDSKQEGPGLEPHCVVSLSKNINPSLVLNQPRETHLFITEILLIGRKKSNQTNKNTVITSGNKHWITSDIKCFRYLAILKLSAKMLVS